MMTPSRGALLAALSPLLLPRSDLTTSAGRSSTTRRVPRRRGLSGSAQSLGELYWSDVFQRSSRSRPPHPHRAGPEPRRRHRGGPDRAGRGPARHHARGPAAGARRPSASASRQRVAGAPATARPASVSTLQLAGVGLLAARLLGQIPAASARRRAPTSLAAEWVAPRGHRHAGRRSWPAPTSSCASSTWSSTSRSGPWSRAANRSSWCELQERQGSRLAPRRAPGRAARATAPGRPSSIWSGAIAQQENFIRVLLGANPGRGRARAGA